MKVRIEERKARDRQTRRTQIVSAARKLAEQEGWPSVTVRRLADEISYSQPVLYTHFQNRDAIVTAVAVEGFQELGAALEKARQRARRGKLIETVALSYLQFAVASPSLYEAMFSLSLSVPFGYPAAPAEMQYAFSHLRELFAGQKTNSETLAELLWASLHGIADLTRTQRLPAKQQKQRLRVLVEVFVRAVEH